MLFAAPYALFIAVVFAYPLGFAVWMSFHQLLLHRPGRQRAAPVRRAATTTATALSDPAVRQAFGNIVVFLVINVPLTVVLSLVLATALNAAIPFRTFFRVSYYVPVRDGERRRGRGVAVPVQLQRAGQPRPRPAGAEPVLAGQRRAGRCRRSRCS